jgi:predicted Rossmann-fold nucleotide-binding protein
VFAPDGDCRATIAARAAGLFAVPVFISSSAILSGALLLLVHGLARHLLRGRDSRRAAVLAGVLVIFGGGLGWMRFVADVAAGHGDPVSVMIGHSYDNSWYDIDGKVTWPYFRIPSVMGHRSVGASRDDGGPPDRRRRGTLPRGRPAVGRLVSGRSP